MHRTWWVAFALLVAAVTAMAASEGRKVEPVTHIGIYVTPYYASSDKPDGRPHVNVARAYDEKLASNKREDILAVRDAIKAQPQMLTPMTLMVLAIRLFDVGERDESVFWFYVAKDRYRTLVGVLDVRSPALGSVPATVRDFATLAGEFINGYAFCDLAKQRAARAKAFAWVEANRYEVLFMEQLPALPGDRSENLSKALATIRQSMDEENRELDDRAAYDDILRARQETGTDMKYCPGGKNALEAGPRDPNRPRGRNPFKAKDGKVTYFNLPGTPYPVADANAATFRHVGGLYGKDVRRVYYGKDVVKGAEPGSFQFLGRQAGRDAKAVYISGDLCPTCDPATFRVLDDTDEYEITNWYVDKNTVFEDNRPHPDMDPSSFQPINTWFSKDRNRVYHSGEPIPYADAASFKLESCGACEVCGEDKNRCYIDARPAKCGCDGKRDFLIGRPPEFPPGVKTFIGGRFGEAVGKEPGVRAGAGFYATNAGEQTLEPVCYDLKANERKVVKLPVHLETGLYRAKPRPENACEFTLTQPALVVGQEGLTEIWLWGRGAIGDEPRWSSELEPGKRSIKVTCRKVERDRVREKTTEITLDLQPGGIYQLSTDQAPEKCAVKARLVEPQIPD